MQEAQSYQEVFALTSGNNFYYKQGNVIFDSEHSSVQFYLSFTYSSPHACSTTAILPFSFH